MLLYVFCVFFIFMIVFANSGMLLNCIASMGKGKTLFSTLFALEFSQCNPKGKIFANYTLKLPNFTYTPLLFLPFSDLENSLIIADDIYALDILKGFLGIIANISRKTNITLIASCQYYTMIPLSMRTLANFTIFPYYDKENDVLYIMKLTLDGNKTYKYVENAVKIAKKIYDTNEIVDFVNETKVKKQIFDISKTYADLEFNVSLYTKNRTFKKRLIKEISEKTKGKRYKKFEKR